jgi:asparagine N-glycosylation enzyme membrane subunit Stt3
MPLIAALPLVVFILSWVGAVASWSVAGYSMLRVLADGSFSADDARARAMNAVTLSATFIVTGIAAGFAGGLFSHLHA